MYDIIFRCDASNIKNIGTGHVFRSLAIADYFTKNLNINKKKVLFIIKKYKKNNYIKQIVKKKNIKLLISLDQKLLF